MAERGEIIEIERHEVKITRPDKVLFPADGITKRDLVEYYRRIAPRMIPYLRSRPLMLERYPDGIERGLFRRLLLPTIRSGSRLRR
jgi:bifunctional non-homologous end joining protein LigD